MVHGRRGLEGDRVHADGLPLLRPRAGLHHGSRDRLPRGGAHRPRAAGPRGVVCDTGADALCRSATPASAPTGLRGRHRPALSGLLLLPLGLACGAPALLARRRETAQRGPDPRPPPRRAATSAAAGAGVAPRPARRPAPVRPAAAVLTLGRRGGTLAGAAVVLVPARRGPAGTSPARPRSRRRWAAWRPARRAGSGGAGPRRSGRSAAPGPRRPRGLVVLASSASIRPRVSPAIAMRSAVGSTSPVRSMIASAAATTASPNCVSAR